jgi:hypothetical protein
MLETLLIRHYIKGRKTEEKEKAVRPTLSDPIGNSVDGRSPASLDGPRAV